MTAMINQEALAKARDAWRDAIIAAVVENMVGGTDDFPSLNMAGFIGTLSELSPFNIEAIPHVDRAGVLEALEFLDELASLSPVEWRKLNPLLVCKTADIRASAIRALAQPAVNTSPEGVGVPKLADLLVGEKRQTEVWSEVNGWQGAYELAVEWSKADTMQLHGGEMTSQEIRTVRAMMLGLAAEFKSRIPSPTDERSK